MSVKPKNKRYKVTASISYEVTQLNEFMAKDRAEQLLRADLKDPMFDTVLFTYKAKRVKDE